MPPGPAGKCSTRCSGAPTLVPQARKARWVAMAAAAPAHFRYIFQHLHILHFPDCRSRELRSD